MPYFLLILSVKSGFPPKILNTKEEIQSLKDIGLRSGDILIVEEIKGGGSSHLKATPLPPIAPFTFVTNTTTTSSRKMVRK